MAANLHIRGRDVKVKVFCTLRGVAAVGVVVGCLVRDVSKKNRPF